LVRHLVELRQVALEAVRVKLLLELVFNLQLRFPPLGQVGNRDHELVGGGDEHLARALVLVPLELLDHHLRIP